MNKLFCLDYDGTYTEFPEIFDAMITSCQRKGYDVILCTMRFEKEEDEGIRYLKEKFKIPVYFTGRMGKQMYLAERLIFPNIWIDDNPRWILDDAR